VKVLLVRHAQTNYNELKLHNDDPSVDVHLTETGRAQATQLAQELKNTNFDHIFVSELYRTQQTAAILNTYHASPVTIDARLNDNRSGYEGKPESDYLQALNQEADKWTARFNDGESLADVKHRVADFINYLHTTDYRSILIVTSEVIMQAFYEIINNFSYQEAEELDIDNCGHIELDI
jgi:probable phosphoglycerate mutase